MKIIINRESVCMGDDRLNHQKTYVFKDMVGIKKKIL